MQLMKLVIIFGRLDPDPDSNPDPDPDLDMKLLQA
jgi:hypothetical protein